MDSIQKVIESLVSLRTRVNNNDSSEHIYGICTEYHSYPEIQYSIHKAMYHYRVHWSDWPLFSGDSSYPVTITEPLGQGLGQIMANVSPITLYTIAPIRMYWATSTEYGRNRRALLDWLINQFEQKLLEQ